MTRGRIPLQKTLCRTPSSFNDTMTQKKNTSRPYNYRNNHPLILLLVVIFLIIGSAAFIVPIRAMSADSKIDTGCKHLLAEEGKEEASTNNNCSESEEQQSGNNEILQLPQSSNDPSIPTIKLGGESMLIFGYDMII